MSTIVAPAGQRRALAGQGLDPLAAHDDRAAPPDARDDVQIAGAGIDGGRRRLGLGGGRGRDEEPAPAAIGAADRSSTWAPYGQHSPAVQLPTTSVVKSLQKGITDMLTLTAIMLSLSMQAAPVPQMRRRVAEPPRTTGHLRRSAARSRSDRPGRRGEDRRAPLSLPDRHRRAGPWPDQARARRAARPCTIVGQARTPAPGGTVEERPVYALPALTLGGIAFQDLSS